MKIVYGACVGDWQQFTTWVLPHCNGAEVLGLSGQSSITTAYNSILDAYAGHEFDVLVLQHVDLEVTDPNATDKLAAVFADPTVGLVGVCGARNIHSLAWWEYATVGHQQINTQTLTFTEPAGDVDLLEGSFLALSRDVATNLRFDPQYTGFHGYDDFAMIVNQSGRRVTVLDLDTWHHCNLGFRSPESGQLWHEQDHKFRVKWGLS